MRKSTKNSDSVAATNDQNDHVTQQYTWDEIHRHSHKKDRWIVIDKHVYNVTDWTKHPGGQAILNHYAGQDATVRIDRKKTKNM